LSSKLTQSFSLREEIFYAQFHWDICLQKTVNQKIKFKEISRFPSIRRDLALIVDNSIKFSDIVSIAKKLGKKQIVQINLFDVYENEKQLGKGKRSYAVSFTFENLEKTLQDKEVDTIIENLLTAYQSELGAYLRK
jgi:phenylalanyl-tRNA synthetase beta chain